MTRRIAISSGHGLHIRGARGSPVPPQLDEVDQARRVVDRVAELLNASGVECQTFHDNTSYDQSTNLETITDWHNDTAFGGGDHDYDVSVHFNAYDHSAHGTEVLYVTQETLAAEMSAAISAAGDFTNRGAKYRSDLYVLNNTREKAVLIETCFCDHTGDSNHYNQFFEDICTTIAETIGSVQVGEPPPDEIEEPPPEEVPPPELTGDNRVEVTSMVEGHVSIYVNGTLVNGHEPCEHNHKLTIKLVGDVTLVINGEEFHNAPPFPETPTIPANQTNIICTIFGGEADDEFSAYGPYDSDGNGPYLNDEDDYVSLPWTVPDAGMNGSARVKVTNRANGKSLTGFVGDKGPWFVDDPYAAPGNAGKRPEAETLFLANEPCPRGPNEGIVPNGAGIDLSPHMADVLGIDGKGVVDFEFVDDAVA